MKMNGEIVSPPPKVYITRGSDESFEYEKAHRHVEKKRSDGIFISEEPIFIDDS